MITLNASGGSITFEFSGNSTYLNDGTITVPVNSLALIIDESDMVTFKKSQSSDIFVSANIAEFGMTKDELESWFKENAVGEVGGGVDSGTVQTMIDESISGKANSSDVYTTGQTSGATEIANALNAKLDTTAYTPVQVSTAITENDTNPVAGGAVYDKVHVTSGESSETVLIFEEITVGGHKQTLSTNYPSGATIVKLDINNIPSYAGYLEWFGADGSVLGGAKITQNGGNVSVNFNHPDLKAMSGTASYADNVLTVEVTGFQNASLSDIAYFFRDLASTYNSIKAVKTAKEYWIKDYVDAALSGKMDTSAYTVDASVNSASTNPVQNQALYNVLSYIYSQLPYLSVIENGDFEGSGNTNFLYKPSVGNVQYCTIQDGVGKDNSRGIVVTNTTAGQQFDTELFVKMNQIIKLGTKFHVEFDYKANKTINGVSTQSHSQPGQYNYWDCIGQINFTDQWQHFSNTVTVSSNMAGTNNDFQTICFTLGATADAEYYFDNFVITVEQKL